MNNLLQLRAVSLAVAAVFSLATLSAQAGVVVFSNLASFNAAVANSGTDGFNDLTPGAALGSTSRSAGSAAYLASVNDTTNAGAVNGGTDLFTADGGGGNVWLSTAVAGNELVFSGFDSLVRGIGGSFFGTDVDGRFKSAQSFTLTLTDILGQVTTFGLDNVSASTGFTGWVSDVAISSLSLRAQQPVGANPGDPYSYTYATVDNLVIGSTVALPEPASLALVGLALAIAGRQTRRRA